MLASHSIVFWIWILHIIQIAQPNLERHQSELATAIEMVSDGDPVLATRLVSIGHFESGFALFAKGDHGRSCGIYQTPCSATPKDILGQTKLAARMIDWSIKLCGDLTAYASGQCGRGKIAAEKRESLAQKLLIQDPSP